MGALAENRASFSRLISDSVEAEGFAIVSMSSLVAVVGSALSVSISPAR